MNHDEKYISIVVSFVEFLKLCSISIPPDPLEPTKPHGSVPFQPWDKQYPFIDTIQKNRLIVVLKARQKGISTIMALYALWGAMTKPGFNCLIISAGEAAASVLLNKIKFAYVNLPEWLKQSLPYGKWSETELTFPSLNSRIRALPSTESGAVGETASLIIMDEHDFHPYPESDLTAAEPTILHGGQIIFISTADKTKPDSLFHILCREAMAGKGGYKFHFIGALDEPGLTMEWYEGEKERYRRRGQLDEFYENNPLTPDEALSPISARAFFDTEKLKALLDLSFEPSIKKYGFVHIYTKFQAKWVYSIGADISQGVGADYQACVLLGKRGTTVEDVAYIHANDLAIKSYAFYTSELAKEYNFPLLGAESNSVGRSYLEELQELGYRRLFFRDDKREKLGWYTDVSSRERSLIDLAQAISDGLLVIRYKPLLLQLLDFQKLEGRSGKIEFKSVGKHDDLVMAVAIAYQMIKDKKTTGVKPKSNLVPVVAAGMYK